MTSNIGAELFRRLESPFGFRRTEATVTDVRSEVMRELERRLSPEFRNRLDDVIVFAPLTRDEVARVARMHLDRVVATARTHGKHVEIVPEAVEAIVRDGYSMSYGARFLKRVIDEQVKIPLSQLWASADSFQVTVVDGAVAVEPLQAPLAEAMAC
jgi:ATP-dependent Clp protease ATP-binding subunit ClpA